MNTTGRTVVIAALGVIGARLLWSGDFGLYVQQRMRWPLLLAVVTLLVFTGHELASLVRSRRADEPAPAHGHSDHHHHHHLAAPRIGWLMLAPLLVILALSPGGLGAAAASRVSPYAPIDSGQRFDPLDRADGPVEMRMVDFIDRAVLDESRSLEGVTVRLAGTVVNDPAIDDGFLLTRFLVSCCAADGIPMQVRATGVDGRLPDDTWVSVDVVWVPEPSSTWVEVEVRSLSIVGSPPADQYESPY